MFRIYFVSLLSFSRYTRTTHNLVSRPIILSEQLMILCLFACCSEMIFFLICLQPTWILVWIVVILVMLSSQSIFFFDWLFVRTVFATLHSFPLIFKFFVFCFFDLPYWSGGLGPTINSYKSTRLSSRYIIYNFNVKD